MADSRVHPREGRVAPYPTRTPPRVDLDAKGDRRRDGPLPDTEAPDRGP